MRTLDYVIFAIYLVGIMILGMAVSRYRQSGDDFHVAGRSMKWFPVGASILATVFSAINFTAFTEEVFSHGLYVLMAVPVFVIVAFPVIQIIMPFYHEMRPVSAYEFLEKKFDLRVRRLASGTFIIWRVFWMSVAIYATAIFLTAVTSINIYILIFIAGFT
ncbi:MAG: hypothetical protein PHR77_21920, partial [Kiritimatiellae bacterium]|nr:hypothetical protein [Kiritimatiellia bacterium]